MTAKKDAGDIADQVKDIAQTLDPGLSAALQTADRFASSGSSPVNLGFAPFELMDGNASCAS